MERLNARGIRVVLVFLAHGFLTNLSRDQPNLILPAANSPAGKESLQRLSIGHLENVVQVSPRVVSGGSPESKADLEALRAVGVTLIISVDGSKPLHEEATSLGLTYVHLPIGYDAVPLKTSQTIAQLTNQANGKVYVHCHHGKHRGPAAIAAALKHLNQAWSSERAAAFMKLAGTDPAYAGLYRSVQAAETLSAEQLSAKPAALPAVVEPEPLVAAMVKIDLEFDALRHGISQAKAPWSSAQREQLAAKARVLSEWLAESGRLHQPARTLMDGSAPKVNDHYAAAVERSVMQMSALESALKWAQKGSKQVESAVALARQACTACHRKYRDELAP